MQHPKDSKLVSELNFEEALMKAFREDEVSPKKTRYINSGYGNEGISEHSKSRLKFSPQCVQVNPTGFKSDYQKANTKITSSQIPKSKYIGTTTNKFTSYNNPSWHEQKLHQGIKGKMLAPVEDAKEAWKMPFHYKPTVNTPKIMAPNRHPNNFGRRR